jgi:hypothetical protein
MVEKNYNLTWNKVNKYLSDLKIKSSSDIERAREVFELGEFMCPEALRGVFISNYRESDGKEQFKDMWFFSDNFIIESLNFIKIDIPKVEITSHSKSIFYISIETQNYNFIKEAKEDSLLHIRFMIIGRFEIDMGATGQNCNTLRSIFERFIKSNIAPLGRIDHQIGFEDI